MEKGFLQRTKVRINGQRKEIVLGERKLMFKKKRKNRKTKEQKKSRSWKWKIGNVNKQWNGRQMEKHINSHPYKVKENHSNKWNNMTHLERNEEKNEPKSEFSLFTDNEPESNRNGKKSNRDIICSAIIFEGAFFFFWSSLLKKQREHCNRIGYLFCLFESTMKRQIRRIWKQQKYFRFSFEWTTKLETICICDCMTFYIFSWEYFGGCMHSCNFISSGAEVSHH